MEKKVNAILFGLAVLVGVLLYSVIVWYPHFGLAKSLYTFGASKEALVLLAHIWIGKTGSVKLLDQILLVTFAVLFIYNTYLMFRLLYIRKKMQREVAQAKQSLTKSVGTVILVGVGSGCAACGVGVIGSILPVIGLTSFGALLSVLGNIMYAIAIILILVTIRMQLKMLRNIK